MCVALILPGCGAVPRLGTGIGAERVPPWARSRAILGGNKAAWGAGIGATVGAARGTHWQKDQQREELKQIEGAQVEAINDGQASKAIFSSGIFFDTGKSDLRPESRRQLNEFAESLMRLPDTDVRFTATRTTPAAMPSTTRYHAVVPSQCTSTYAPGGRKLPDGDPRVWIVPPH